MDLRSDQLSLDLYEGSVQTNDCVDRPSHTLVAGQGIRASCSRKQWTVVSLAEAASAEADAERNTESGAVARKVGD